MTRALGVNLNQRIGNTPLLRLEVCRGADLGPLVALLHRGHDLLRLLGLELEVAGL